jgi:hypothetical protein
MKGSASGGALIVLAAAVLNAQTAPNVSIQTPVPMSSAQNITLIKRLHHSGRDCGRPVHVVECRSSRPYDSA